MDRSFVTCQVRPVLSPVGAHGARELPFDAANEFQMLVKVRFLLVRFSALGAAETATAR